MKYLVYLLFFPGFVFAQENNDPEATAILDKLSNDISTFSTVDIDFNLLVDFPQSVEESKKGKLIQEGDKFYVDIAGQEIINDGKDLYMIFKEDNTVQINSAASSEGSFDVFNPVEFINLYKTGDFIYGITGEEDFEGERVVLIEFKPVDRYSEYSKIRIALNKKRDFPKYLKIFNKDGSRITLNVNSFKIDSQIDSDQFVFNKTEYPGIVVEDLRID